MTGVIQLVFPNGWVNFHLYWASLAVALLAIGPGWLSVDHRIGFLAAQSTECRMIPPLPKTAPSGFS